MWPASPPVSSARDAAVACARGTRDSDLAQRLTACQDQLEANSNELQLAAQQDRLHQVTAATFVTGNVSDAEMKQLYLGHLGRSGRPASHIRDQLLGAAPHGLCCYC